MCNGGGTMKELEEIIKSARQEEFGDDNTRPLSGWEEIHTPTLIKALKSYYGGLEKTDIPGFEGTREQLDKLGIKK